jgi:hypothetical protein
MMRETNPKFRRINSHAAQIRRELPAHTDFHHALFFNGLKASRLGGRKYQVPGLDGFDQKVGALIFCIIPEDHLSVFKSERIFKASTGCAGVYPAMPRTGLLYHFSHSYYIYRKLKAGNLEK